MRIIISDAPGRNAQKGTLGLTWQMYAQNNKKPLQINAAAFSQNSFPVASK